MKKQITMMMMLMLFIMGGITGSFAQWAKDNGDRNPNFTYIDDFEEGLGLWFSGPEQSGSTTGIILEDDEGNLLTYIALDSITVNPVTGSNYAMELTIAWNNDIEYEGTPTHLARQVLHPANADLPERYFQPGQALEVFIYGDGSGNRFRFMVRDGATPRTLEGSQWITIDWSGWKRITWDYNDPDNVVGWVNGNGVMDGINFFFDSFQLTKDPGGTATGTTLYFDDLRIVDPFDVIFNIAGANGSEVISINNMVYPEGHTEFQFFPGEYQYFVQKDGFITHMGTFEVDDADLTIDITLQPGTDPEYTATFTVLDQDDELVDDAIFTISDQTYPAGQYAFDLTPGFYHYTVNKELYYETTGMFTITDANVFINVVLNEIPDVYDHIYLTWDVASTANTAAYREEHYGVFVAVVEDENQVFDAEDYVMIFEETLSSSVPNWQYQPRQIDISQFSEQNIRVAFRHFNSTDKDRIVIDNVMIRGEEASLEAPDTLLHQNFMGGVPDFNPEEEELPEYDDEWLPEGWFAVDLDNDGYNWYYAIVVEQDFSITAHMRSQSWSGTAPLTPDNWLVTPMVQIPLVLFREVTFDVVDVDGNAINDAVITFNGEEFDPGHYVFTVVNGTYDYEVNKADYEPVSGTVVVDGDDVTVDVTLELIGIYEVTFRVNMLPYGGFEPGDDEYAYITGNFPGWDNADPGVFEEARMEKTNNVFIFVKTINMPAGTYNYLYFDGPSFANAEWDINLEWRTVVVEGEMLVEDVFAEPTSVTDIEAGMINLFPNPASNKVNIQAGSNILQVSIYNIAGQQVYNRQVNAESHSVELNDLNNGIYMVRILTSDGMQTMKLQVVK